MGDQSVLSDLYGSMRANRRRQFTFNRIQRTINMIDGHQRRNRKSTIAVPLENGDNDTADQFTKVLMHVYKRDDISETISNAFRGAITTGMNLLQVWVEDRKSVV